MIPAEVWTQDKLPVLGTGKVDMMAVVKLVHDRLAEKAASQPETMARATG
jgi:hypothetical protein